MEFSKENIVSKYFSKKILGGLSEFEVRDFLHVLAEEIRHLHQKNTLQKDQIQKQEDIIKDYHDREHILKKAISSAEKWAEKIRKDAENNSSLILEKAQNKSQSLIQEAQQSLRSVYHDITHLKSLQLQFKTGLKAALQVQLDLLEQDPIFSPSSSLPAQNLDNFLDKPIKNEEGLQKHFSSEEEIKNEESFTNTTEESDPLKINEKELSSLKESLKSLDKNFS